MIECVWKDVVGYEEYFSVSSTGEIFSKRTNKVLKQNTTKEGYKTVATKIGGRGGLNLCFKVHRLVATAFIPNPEGKPYVNHIDGCTSNNCVSNLEWCTASENAIHAITTGLTDIGHILNLNRMKRKLSDEQVIFIRQNFKLPKSERLSASSIAKMFNINRTTVTRIVDNECYQDVS